MVTSCIPRIDSDRFIMVRESYRNICNNNDCAAALLNFYEFRHNVKLSELKEKLDNNPRYKVSRKDYLIQGSYKYLQSSLLDAYGRNSIMSANQLLSELNFIDIVMNVANPNGGLPVNHVLLNVNDVIAALDVYVDQRPKRDVDTNVLKGTLQRPKRDVATSQKGRTKDILIENIDIIHTHTENFEKISEIKNEGIAPMGGENERKIYPYDVDGIFVELKTLYCKSETHRNLLCAAFEQYGIPKENRKEAFTLFAQKYISHLLGKQKEVFYLKNPVLKPFEIVLSMQELHTDFLGAFNWLSKAGLGEVKKFEKEKGIEKPKAAPPSVVSVVSEKIVSPGPDDIDADGNKANKNLNKNLNRDTKDFNYNVVRLYDNGFSTFLRHLGIVVGVWTNVVGKTVVVENAEKEYEFWVKYMGLDIETQETIFNEKKAEYTKMQEMAILERRKAYLQT